MDFKGGPTQRKPTQGPPKKSAPGIYLSMQPGWQERGGTASMFPEQATCPQHRKYTLPRWPLAI